MTGSFDTAFIIASDWKSGSSDQNILKGFINPDSRPYDAVLIKPLSGFSLPQKLNNSSRPESDQTDNRIFRSESNASTLKALSIPSPNSKKFEENFIEQSSSTPNVFKAQAPFKPSRQNWIYTEQSNDASKFLKKIIDSNDPIQIEEKEEIFYQGQRSFVANKSDIKAWKGPIPINQYPINEDESPEIMLKKSEQKIEYDQEIAVRYLLPPTPPPQGEIIIKHEKDIVIPPAPPLLIRQQPPRPKTPPPLIIREAPPKPIQKLEPKIITIPGRKLPPPPRKVIIERLPELPPKPQSIVIERWLPYQNPKRRVIYQKPEDIPVNEKPKNVIIQWEAPNVVINRKYKDLGIVKADPEEYVSKYWSEIKSENDLPDFAKNILQQNNHFSTSEETRYVLEGDLDALSLVDSDIGNIEEENLVKSSSRIINDIIDKHIKNINNPKSDISLLIYEIIDLVKAKTSEIISFNEAMIVIKSINEKLNFKSNDAEIENYLKSVNLQRDSTLELSEFKNHILLKYVK